MQRRANMQGHWLAVLFLLIACGERSAPSPPAPPIGPSVHVEPAPKAAPAPAPALGRAGAIDAPAAEAPEPAVEVPKRAAAASRTATVPAAKNEPPKSSAVDDVSELERALREDQHAGNKALEAVLEAGEVAPNAEEVVGARSPSKAKRKP